MPYLDITPPQDCRSRGDCGLRKVRSADSRQEPPQDCRSRGDCGSLKLETTGTTRHRLKIAAVAATAARFSILTRSSRSPRLKIAAVAATAATCKNVFKTRRITASRLPQSRRLRLQTNSGGKICFKPPQDCRSRGDCGWNPRFWDWGRENRLKIAAVAATAALPRKPARKHSASASRLPQSRRLRLYWLLHMPVAGYPASRLPQSRRLRRDGSAARGIPLYPPQDCRSRGDCGFYAPNLDGEMVGTASRLPQSRRLRRCRGNQSASGP